MTNRKFNFQSRLKKLNQLKAILPKICGNEAVIFFQDSFKNQGFTDQTLKKWQEVKRRIKGTNPYIYPKKKDLKRRTRPILIGKGSGRLRRSIIRKYTSWDRTVIKADTSYADTPYAKYHNEGAKHLPKRQFMGDSKQLNVNIKNIIAMELEKIFNR